MLRGSGLRVHDFGVRGFVFCWRWCFFGFCVCGMLGLRFMMLGFGFGLADWALDIKLFRVTGFLRHLRLRGSGARGFLDSVGVERVS